jgi:hypothetical protein
MLKYRAQITERCAGVQLSGDDELYVRRRLICSRIWVPDAGEAPAHTDAPPPACRKLTSGCAAANPGFAAKPNL